MSDPDSTSLKRTAILEAATELFSRQGLAATSMKAIGRAARVNPALIYYYFADKSDLYHEVLGSLISELPARLGAGISGHPSPAEGLAAMVRAQAELFLAVPALPRMIARELADHEASHATPVLREQAQKLLRTITGLVRAGQESGEFRADFEPELVAVSIMSQVNWFCIAGPAIEQILNRPGVARDPAAVRQFADHVVRFAMTGLTTQVRST